MTSKIGIAVVCIVIVGLAIAGLSLSGNFPSIPGTGNDTLPSSNVISLWNKTLVPTGWPTVLTATFTLPTYSSAVLHVEWTLTFINHYYADSLGVQTTLSLDGVAIDSKLDSTLKYHYEKALSASANVIHTVKLAVVTSILGPGYSTFNETATGWISYK